MLRQYTIENNSLEITYKKENLKVVRAFVTRVLEQYALSEVIEIPFLVVAVDEVCTNLMIHTPQCNSQKFIKIMIKVDVARAVTIDIVHQGMHFDIESYQTPSIKQIIQKKQKKGLGLLLIKRIMDKVETIRYGDYHTCRLFKKIRKLNLS
ncbi:MAG: ATP-binding protein [Cytophagales bacterium]|nr:ATP-binding protein [Cytophagales bacterium]